MKELLEITKDQLTSEQLLALVDNKMSKIQSVAKNITKGESLNEILVGSLIRDIEDLYSLWSTYKVIIEKR